MKIRGINPGIESFFNYNRKFPELICHGLTSHKKKDILSSAIFDIYTLMRYLLSEAG
jgi:hypothetical protein